MLLNWDKLNKKQTKFISALYEKMTDRILNSNESLTEEQKNALEQELNSQIEAYLKSGIDKDSIEDVV